MTDAPAHQAVDRALRVIETLGEHPHGCTLDELARATEIPKASLHRTLAAMRPRHFATQLEPGGRYFLGSSAMESAFRFHAGLDSRQLLHPLVAAVRDEFGQTSHLAGLDGADIIYLDKVEADVGIRTTSVIGGRVPAHATGAGKALLAGQLSDRTAVHAWVARHGPLAARTTSTATTADRLADQLEQVRLDGYALDDEESGGSLVCVATTAALPSPSAGPATAVSVTGLSDQMRSLGLAAIGRRLLELVRAYALTGQPEERSPRADAVMGPP